MKLNKLRDKNQLLRDLWSLFQWFILPIMKFNVTNFEQSNWDKLQPYALF